LKNNKMPTANTLSMFIGSLTCIQQVLLPHSLPPSADGQMPIASVSIGQLYKKKTT